MLTVEAWTRTSSSSGAGSGRGTSATRTTSGPPKRSAIAARIVLVDWVDVAVSRCAVVMIGSLTL